MTSVAHGAVIVTGVLACAWDLRTRRIPNALTLGAALLAIALHTGLGGLDGLGTSVGGFAAGTALFLPFFMLGGMGGGDVKLLAAFGAWLGPSGALWVALYAGVAGGVLALVVAAFGGYVGIAFRNLWHLLMYWRVIGMKPFPELTLSAGAGPRLAYSLPLLAGVVWAIWLG